MSLVVADFVRETLDLKGFSFVTSVNDSGRNEMTRVFGYVFNEDTGRITVLVCQQDTDKILACLAKTNKMAVVIGDPLSFKTIQIKGEYLGHRDATEEEVTLITDVFRVSQNNAMTMFGMPDGLIRLWDMSPTMAIEMQCTEIFDQTPRQHTGNKIS